MKKFAAIFAAVILTVSVFVVSVSAKLFTDDTLYSYTGPVGALSISGGNNGVSCYSFSVFDSNHNVIFSYGFDEEVVIYRNTYGSGVDLSVPQFYGYVDGVRKYEIFSPVPIPQASSMVLYSSVSGTYNSFTKITHTEPAAVSSFGGSIFEVGNSLISFVTANWITLISVSAFVLVLSFGAIRRLIKGV